MFIYSAPTAPPAPQPNKLETPFQQYSPNVHPPPDWPAYNPTLSPPTQGPNHDPHMPPGGKWKRILVLHAAASIVVLAINVIAAIFVASQNPSGGIAPVYTGSCSFASEAVVWIGLAINVLSVLLTTASDSCMQRLCAPTRRDVDAAHLRGRWLDVGVSSGRNFSAMGLGRRMLYCLLGLSSVPLAVV